MTGLLFGPEIMVSLFRSTIQFTAPFTRQKIFGAAWMKVVRVPKKYY